MKQAKWSKILTWVLCVAMLFTLLPANVFADNAKSSAETAAVADEIETMAIKKPPVESSVAPEPDPEPEPVDPGTLADDTVAINLKTNKQYTTLDAAAAGSKKGETIQIVRDCTVSKSISPISHASVYMATTPVTVTRAEGYTGTMFSYGSGNYDLTLKGPITLDGQKSESKDTNDWAYTSSLINISGKGGKIVIGSGVVLKNNRAFSKSGTVNGGAIYISGAVDLTIEEGAKIIGCEAKTSGGAIYAAGPGINYTCEIVIAGEISGNKALGLNGYDESNQVTRDGVGGAIFVCGSANGNMYSQAQNKVVIKGTAVLDGNSALYRGGAIGIMQQDNSTRRAQVVVEEGAKITNNSARLGGAISAATDSVNGGFCSLVEINGAVDISGNKATEKGNGIYCDNNGHTYNQDEYCGLVLSGAASFEDDIYLDSEAKIGLKEDWTGEVNVSLPEQTQSQTRVAVRVLSIEENGTVPETLGQELDPSQPANLHLNLAGKAVDKNGDITEEANVHIYIYKNGNTSKPVVSTTLKGVASGTVVKLDINDYYKSSYGFDFSGWYGGDGAWNSGYMNGKPGTETVTIGNGWYNIKAMVTDYETVHVMIYANGNTEKAVKDVAIGTALHGSKLKVSDINIADYYTSPYTWISEDYGYKFEGWFNDGKWNSFKAGKEVAPLKDDEITVNGWTNLKCMVTDEQPVQLYIYRNGDTEKPYQTLYLDPVLRGETLDVSAIDINDYYSHKEGFVFEGWYNDGGWSSYLAGGKPTALTEIKVNGWTNLKCMVTDYETVTVQSVVNGEKKSAEEVWSSDKVLHGTPLAEVLEAIELEEREGYTIFKWYDWDNFGQKIADDAVVLGPTNVYYSYEANSYEITYTDGVGGAAFEDVVLIGRYGFDTPVPEGLPTQYDEYLFTGWEPSVQDKVTGAITYTAKWEHAVARLEETKKLYASLNEIFEDANDLFDAGQIESASITLLQDWTENLAEADEKYAHADAEFTWFSGVGKEFNVVIDLGGHTLKGTGKRAVLYFNRPTARNTRWNINITIQNGTITGGYSSGSEPSTYSKNGGAIEVASNNSKMTLNLKDLTITGNRTTGNGGAVYVSSANTIALTVDNCKINGNEAANGGAVYGRSITVKNNSEITGNKASATGGAIYMWGTISMDLTVEPTAKIYNNTAATYGDDIVMATTAKRNYEYHLADPAAWGVEGVDAWCVDGFDGEYDNFKTLETVTRYDYETSKKLSEYDLKLGSSKPGHMIAIKAAAYLPEYKITYKDGMFNGEAFEDIVLEGRQDRATPVPENVPEQYGEYIFKGWEPAIAEKVTGDATYVAQWEHAVARLEETGKLYMSLNEVFDEAEDAFDPGRDGTSTLDSITVTLLQDWTENLAEADEKYAHADSEFVWVTSLYSPDKDLNLVFDLNNHTLTGTGRRSVLSFRRTGSGAAKWSFNVTVKNGTITGGVANAVAPSTYANNGGGIEINSAGKADVLFQNLTIKGNRTTGSGGAIYVQTSNSHPVTVEGCTITDNEAASGGAIYGRELTVKKSTITGNKATGEGEFSGRGGAIYMWGSITFELNVDAESRIYGNSAVHLGDDIVMCTTSTRTFEYNLTDPAQWGVDGIDAWCVDGFDGLYTDYQALEIITRYNLETSKKLASLTMSRGSRDPGYIIAIKAADYLPEYKITYKDGFDGKAFEDIVLIGREGRKTPVPENVPEQYDEYIFRGWSPEIVDPVTGDATYVAQWEHAVARLEETGKLYTSLKEAFEDAEDAFDPGRDGSISTPDSVTVTLLQNWTEPTPDIYADVDFSWNPGLSKYSKNVNFTFDLNGHTLTGSGNKTVLYIGRSGSGSAKIWLYVTIKNGTITGGNGSSYGGGIGIRSQSNSNVDIVLKDLVIENNKTTGTGGGVYVATSYAHSVTVDNCIIRNNEAASGGGISSRELTVVKSTITDNKATGDAKNSGRGGGIYIWGNSTAKLSIDAESKIYHNTASQLGDDIVAANTRNKTTFEYKLADPAKWGVEGIDAWCVDGFDGEYDGFMAAESYQRYSLDTSKKLANLEKTLGTRDNAYVIAIKAADYLPDYTVTYKDGLGGSVFADVVYTAKEGKPTPAFNAEGTDPTREGYTFAGWDPEVAGTVSGNAVYNAKWTANEYEITVDPANGSAEYTVTLTYEDTIGDKVSTPTRAGYTFAGWKDGEGNDVETAKKYDGSFTKLTAQWAADDCIITVDPNNGDKTYTVIITCDDVVGTKLTTPTRKHYTFAGWVDENGKAVDLTAKYDGSFTKVTAQWTATKYIVTVDPQNGSATYTVELSFEDVIGSVLTEPARENYNFAGWIDNDGKDVDVNKTYDGSFNKLTAKWTAKEYLVTVDPKNGTEAYPVTITLEDVINDKIADPVRENYTFAGWTDENGNTVDTSKKYDGSFTKLNANWTAAYDFFTFTKDANTEYVVLDKEAGVITFKAGAKTVEEIKALFVDETLTFAKAAGDAVAEGSVGTGFTVTSTIGENSKTISVLVLGDVDGDGDIDKDDYTTLLETIKGTVTLEGLYFKAADVISPEGKLTTRDATKLNAFINGTVKSF